MPHVEPLPFREVSGYDGIDELVFLGKDDYQKQTKSHPVSLVKALDRFGSCLQNNPRREFATGDTSDSVFIMRPGDV